MSFKRNRPLLPRLALLVVLGAGAAEAQSGGGYSIDWKTVDGGGGASSSDDGRYSVTGTIGQADASLVDSQGGGFLVTGGFWVIRAVTVPALTIPAVMALGLAVMQVGKRRIRSRLVILQSRVQRPRLRLR